MLYGAERYYRDHFLHVVRVWLTGILILTDSNYISLDTITFDDKKADYFIVDDQEKFAVWTIIALCHDLGYPLEKIGSINALLRRMIEKIGKAYVNDFAYEFPRQHQFIDDFVVRFISSKVRCDIDSDESCTKVCDTSNRNCLFKTDIQTKYYLKLSKSFEEQQHGILSSVLVMKWLVYFLESDFDLSIHKKLSHEDARQFLIRREILRAISVHTCPDIYHLKSRTYSFLLIVCDDLQEWDRPTLHDLRIRQTAITDVVLHKYTKRNLHCAVKYTYSASHDFDKEMENHYKHIFRRLHKILRSALEVEHREFTCRWDITVTVKKTKIAHTISFINSKTNAKLTLDGEPLENWLYGEVMALYLAIRLKFLAVPSYSLSLMLP